MFLVYKQNFKNSIGYNNVKLIKIDTNSFLVKCLNSDKEIILNKENFLDYKIIPSVEFDFNNLTSYTTKLNKMNPSFIFSISVINKLVRLKLISKNDIQKELLSINIKKIYIKRKDPTVSEYIDFKKDVVLLIRNEDNVILDAYSFSTSLTRKKIAKNNSELKMIPVEKQHKLNRKAKILTPIKKDKKQRILV